MWKYSNNYLQHHGILGMKWGVRRYQNEDGTLTEEGKRRYSDPIDENNLNKKHSKLGNKIINNNTEYFKKRYKLNNEQAKLAAEKKYKYIKRAMIIGGIALASAGAIYAYKKYGRDYVDRIIKKGTSIQTLQADANRFKTNDMFYSSYKKSDNLKYLGGFSKEGGLFGFGGTTKNKITFDANDNLKIASIKNSEKIFNNLRKNNKEFDNQVKKYLDEHKGVGGLFAATSKNDYHEFNRYALLNNPYAHGDDKMIKTFYDELKKKGYAGLMDVNDRKYSGFKTDAVMLFSENIPKNYKVNSISNEEIAKGEKYFNNFLKTEAYKQKIAEYKFPIAGYGTAGTLGTIAISAEAKAVNEVKK